VSEKLTTASTAAAATGVAAVLADNPILQITLMMAVFFAGVLVLLAVAHR